MRWGKPTPYNDDRRIREGFLWFPKTPLREYETRWLERAKWEERYYAFEWVAIKWRAI